jgi:hypothetical protein
MGLETKENQSNRPENFSGATPNAFLKLREKWQGLSNPNS